MTLLSSFFSAVFPSDRLIQNGSTATLIAAIIAYLSYKVKFLTGGGAVATFILALLIFGLGGFKWALPILTFFILSSILSKMRKKKNSDVELYFEKSGRRDQFQVLANGGIGGVLVILNSVDPQRIYYLLYLSSLASACADTWATEIGTWKKTATYNILNRKPVAQGTSGGISIPGTSGALLGSITIAISGIGWSEIPYIQFMILILSAGMAGSVIDSILGATIQSQNRCGTCGKITERKIHCGIESVHFKGSKWINNDAVNLISGLAGVLLILFLNSIFKI